MRFLSVCALAFFIVGLTGCDLLGGGPDNSPPVIEDIQLRDIKGGELDTASVGLQQKVMLIASARDPDGDSLEYRWRSPEGEMLSGTRDTSQYDWQPGTVEYGPDEKTTRWRAPEVVGRYEIILTVSDGKTTTKESTVIVMEPDTVRYKVEVSGEMEGVLIEYNGSEGNASFVTDSSPWETEVLIPPGWGILLYANAQGEKENPDAEDSPRKTVTVTAQVFINGTLEATKSNEGEEPVVQITTEDVGDALP